MSGPVTPDVTSATASSKCERRVLSITLIERPKRLRHQTFLALILRSKPASYQIKSVGLKGQGFDGVQIQLQDGLANGIVERAVFRVEKLHAVEPVFDAADSSISGQ